MVEDRKLTAKEELKWRAEFETLAADIIQPRDESGILVFYSRRYTK